MFDPAPPAIRRLTDWLRSETGGWSFIGALAVVLILIAVVALAAPRVAQSPITGRPSVPVIAPTSDVAREADLALVTVPVLPAKPFVMPPSDLTSYGRALDCLTAAVYYEAGSETSAGQAAVAQVVLNRLRHPAYPRTVCGVVFQGANRATGCQFTFACDGALARRPSVLGWQRARRIATAALNGHVEAEVGTATHYHTDAVAPDWALRLVRIVQVQNHIFYRWSGTWGQPHAFRAAYLGGEADLPQMAGLSSAVQDAPEPILTLALVPAEPLKPMSPLEPVRVMVPIADVEEIAPPPPVSDARPQQPRLVRTTSAIASDPLLNPGEVRPEGQRSRPRIPAPSGW